MVFNINLFKNCLSAEGRKIKLHVIAPMPEQIGTQTMHVSEVSGGTYQQFPSPKMGKLGQIEFFSILLVMSMGKKKPKIMFFKIHCTKSKNNTQLLR